MSDDALRDRLDALEAAGLRRHLRVPEGIDLSSNDTLGLSRHPQVRQALQYALEAGVPHGSGGSRLLSGQHPRWSAWEARFAAWQGTESALHLSSGFAANSGLIAALAEPGDLILSDALNHASLIDGARLARADRQIVRHGCVDALSDALRRAAGRRCWVVVESVYSMDGDEPDLGAIAELCERHSAKLIVDEAHATGMCGPTGEGRVSALGLRPWVYATVHPLGKAFGQQGAIIAGSATLTSWLVQRCRPFVFSTAPAPFLAAGLHAALDVVQGDAALRARPRALADRLRAALAHRVSTGESTSHILPIHIGDATGAMRTSDALRARGWDVRAIRPPTVPEGTSRLRVVMRACLSEGQVDALADTLHEVLS